MKHPLAIAITATLTAGTIAGAAPLKLDQVPAESSWFLHLDLDGLRSTETGKELVSQLEEKKGRQFRALKRMFSVNPLTDLGSVTLMGPGKKDVAMVLIEGRFDRGHIEDIIGAAKDYGTHTHGNVTVHSWTDDNKDKAQFGAFVNDGLIAVSEHEELLHDALDVLAGKAPSLKADPYFKQAGAALIAGWAELAEIEMDQKESQLLRKAEALRIAVGENSGRISGRIAIDARDRETAERMQRVLDGIAAFAELAEIVGAEVGLKATLAGGGNRVDAAIDMPVAEFLKFVEEHGVLDEKQENDDKKDE